MTHGLPGRQGCNRDTAPVEAVRLIRRRESRRRAFRQDALPRRRRIRHDTKPGGTPLRRFTAGSATLTPIVEHQARAIMREGQA